MRLLTRNKLWRAFPELDSYSDFECQEFIRQANITADDGTRRTLAYFILAPTFLAIAFRLAEVAISLINPRGTAQTAASVILIFLLLVLFTTPLLLLLVLRDFFLHRRIKEVIHIGGRCPNCRYSLIGLPCGPDQHVQCPECGTHTVVDASLTSLIRPNMRQI